jgi:hypothetical protein
MVMFFQACERLRHVVAALGAVAQAVGEGLGRLDVVGVVARVGLRVPTLLLLHAGQEPGAVADDVEHDRRLAALLELLDLFVGQLLVVDVVPVALGLLAGLGRHSSLSS